MCHGQFQSNQVTKTLLTDLAITQLCPVVIPLFSAAELEDVLQTHPAVQEAAVVSKPHVSDTQHPIAFVVSKLGTVVTEQQILDFVDERVEDYKRLRGGVRFLDVLPRTIIGKVVRKTLRDYSLQ
ncbi:hypothetical protein J6590_012484 [Homalodisca vitripennis]|nr:hypothetical protein J6590_012484 [Homalodisca vitripennis]